MSNPLYEALTGLVEEIKREIAAHPTPTVDAYAAGQLVTLRRLSDTLEAALAAAVPAPPQEEKASCARCGHGRMWHNKGRCDIGAAYIGDSEKCQCAGFVAAALPAPPQGWQPMESAPTTNREAVLLAVENRTGHRLTGEAYYCQSDTDESDAGWWWANEGPGDYHASKIEHGFAILGWQPLPAPPSALLGGLEDREGKE